jgi:hypothetical protein
LPAGRADEGTPQLAMCDCTAVGIAAAEVRAAAIKARGD